MSNFTFTADYDELECVPVGEYEVIIQNAEVTEFASSKNTGVRVTLVIRDDVEQQSSGRVLKDNLVAIPTAKYKFVEVSKAAGVPKGKVFEDLHDFCDSILGRPVRVHVMHKEYSGRTWEQVFGYQQGKPYEGTPSDIENMIESETPGSVSQRVIQNIRARRQSAVEEARAKYNELVQTQGD